jgi:hydrogenase nickel incorporation protein HypB
MRLTIKQNILGANAERAASNRKCLDSRHVRMINLMSAPGSGKTSVIMRAIDRLRDKYRIAVIEGSIASSIDADRIMQQNIPAVQINPEGGCHLDARMIHKALDTLDLDRINLIFLENVGNLVCTADFELGAHKNVVILSVPEGDDKPHKYPAVFMAADVILVNKIDVLSHFDFNVDAFPEIISGLNPSARVFQVSAKTGEGMDDWFSWIEETLGMPAFRPQQRQT